MHLNNHINTFVKKYFPDQPFFIDAEISPISKLLKVGDSSHEDLIFYFNDVIEEMTCSLEKFDYVSKVVGLDNVNEHCFNTISSFFDMLNHHNIFKKIFLPIKLPSFGKSLPRMTINDKIQLQQKYFLLAKPYLYKAEEQSIHKYPDLISLDIRVSFPFMFTADSELKCLPVIALFYNKPYAVRLGVNIAEKTIHPIVNGSTHYAEFFANNPAMTADFVDNWCHRYLDDLLLSVEHNFDTSMPIEQKVALVEMVFI